MRSIQFFPAGTRRPYVLALAFALVSLIVAGAGVRATTPSAPESMPAAEAQDPASPLAFTAEAGLMFNQIKAGQTADFEMVMGRLREALAKSEDPMRRQQAAGWKVFRSVEPGPEGTVLYIYVIDPAVKGLDYDVTKILSEVFPEEVQALYEKYREAFAGLNRVNLQLVQDFTTVAAVPAADEGQLADE